MKLFEVFAARPRAGGYHSAILTTFAVEFGAFERILLPQLAGSGAGNVLLMADAGMVAMALEEGFSPPASAGRDYAIHSPAAQAGVFHPKIVFQVGREGARVVIGSANATSAGLAGNLEVVSKVECSAAPGPERAFVVAVWDYLLKLAREAGPSALAALNWLERRTPWLAAAESSPEVRVWDLADSSAIGLFASQSAEDRSILDRFIEAVGDEPISRLVIASPYWDGGLVAVRNLIQALRPAQTVLCIQAGKALFPKAAVRNLDLELVELDVDGKRFSHAKIILATGPDHDHVLSGSANCTLAALGSRAVAGANAEASIYRRLPPGRATEALGLQAILERPGLSLADIPDLAEEEPLPLAEAASRWGGRFEIRASAIAWRPEGSIDLSQADVDLLSDLQGEPLAVLKAGRWRREGDLLLASLPEAAGDVRFAVVRAGDWRSMPAIVSHAQALGQRRRERSSRGVDRIEKALAGRQSLTLDLLELLSLLEQEDRDAESSIVAARRTSTQRSKEAEEAGERLGYDDFLRIRQSAGPRNPTAPGVSTGGGVDVLRQFLNELVQGSKTSAEDPEDQISKGMEDEEGEGSPDLPPPPPPRRREPPPKRGDEAEPATLDMDPAKLERAVAQYNAVLASKTERGPVGSPGVLRMRLFLMLILANRAKLPRDLSEQGWPRLTLRVLAAFFHGENAAITRLTVDLTQEEMPLDFMEAWATVTVAFDLLAELADAPLGADEKGQRFLRYVQALDLTSRARTGLTEEERSSPAFRQAVEDMRAYLARQDARLVNASQPPAG